MINAGSTFLVSDFGGALNDRSEHGLFAADTRFLSGWELRLGTHGLNLLGEQRPHYSQARWDLIAPNCGIASNGIVSEVAVSIQRTINDRQLHEDIVIEHFGAAAVQLRLQLLLAWDFADIFEVRSQDWQERAVKATWRDNILRTEYRGPENFVRIHELEVRSVSTVTPDTRGVEVELSLPPGARWRACLHHRLLDAVDMRLPGVECPLDRGAPSRPAATSRRRRRGNPAAPMGWSTIQAAEPRFQRALVQARSDLESLCLPGPAGRVFPAAGVPWFATLFGRDSLICGMQTMLLGPEFALGALDQLARLQARSLDPFRDAEPGKICHEMRIGEWAVTGRIPQRPYYGSADSTPLYLWLLGECYRWHGDAGGLRRFLPVAERCLRWIDEFGDVDGDGLQEYGPREATGFPNQCWRDSPSGVPDETGATPVHPIATCELQAYVHAAKLAAAPLFDAWGDRARAARLRQEAAALKQRFHEAFWVADLEMIPLGLDGNKRPIVSFSSNPGHCLWGGIVEAKRQARVADRLMSSRLFSGFGVRTLDSDHAAYDPHSYHRGSVWPHDTIIAAAGLRAAGHEKQAWRVVEGLVAATARFPDGQLPEVFSGLDRQQTPVPVPYWRANVPQAWAAGSLIHAVAVLLGIEPDLPRGQLHLAGTLPPWCPSIHINGLRLGESRFDLSVERSGQGVDVDVRGWVGTPPEIVLGPRLT